MKNFLLLSERFPWFRREGFSVAELPFEVLERPETLQESHDSIERHLLVSDSCTEVPRLLTFVACCLSPFDQCGVVQVRVQSLFYSVLMYTNALTRALNFKKQMRNVLV